MKSPCLGGFPSPKRVTTEPNRDAGTHAWFQSFLGPFRQHRCSEVTVVAARASPCSIDHAVNPSSRLESIHQGHARCRMGLAGIPSAINTPCSSSSLRCAAMQPLGDLHCLLYPYRWEVGPSHMPGALPRCPETRDMSFLEGDILGGLMTLSCM